MASRHRTIPILICAAIACAAFSGASASPAFGCRHTGAGPGKVSEKRAGVAVACLIDARRKAHGLGPLDTRGSLNRAAMRHSAYMVDHFCFAHVCPGEASLLARILSSGLSLLQAAASGWGENIAWGQRRRGTPKRIVRAWMHSPPHREAILSKDFEMIGVGVAWHSPTASKQPAGTYTADFAYRNG